MRQPFKRSKLTPREQDIVRLLFDGYSNREMGEALHLSPLTVRNYISNLILKYEARNRTDLLARIVVVRRQQHRRILL
ncbi:MAG: response regulator transcription factor [Chloroflexi bacterium]|nr:response regulator transcription factor [Chloroflexota bacterium]